jgi:hypothetical protein
MLASSETSLSLLYTHVHVHVHVHVHYARVHFLYSVSGCASGCSSFLVIFFLARRGYSLLCLSLTSHPHIRTSTHPTHSATSRNFPQPPTTSHNLTQPHICTPIPHPILGGSPPLDQIARSCRLACPSSRYRANHEVAWGIRGFRYSWSPAGMITSPAGHHTHALDLLSIRQNSCWLTTTEVGEGGQCVPEKERAFNALRGGRSSGALVHRMYACSDRQPFSRA